MNLDSSICLLEQKALELHARCLPNSLPDAAYMASGYLKQACAKDYGIYHGRERPGVLAGISLPNKDNLDEETIHDARSQTDGTENREFLSPAMPSTSRCQSRKKKKHVYTGKISTPFFLLHPQPICSLTAEPTDTDRTLIHINKTR